MMKLWLLRPVENDPLGETWYDKAFGFVVRAETETHARYLASNEAGDEKRECKRARDNPWLHAEHSSCTELTSEGESAVIIRDFAAA